MRITLHYPLPSEFADGWRACCQSGGVRAIGDLVVKGLVVGWLRAFALTEFIRY